MSLTVNLFYTGTNGSARKFAEEGNEAYDYYLCLDDPETVLLIDQWRDQAAIDAHHASPMMARIAELRDRHDLHMRVRRYVDLEGPAGDERFVRR